MKQLLAVLTLSFSLICAAPAQVPLPNNVMYDLADCGTSKEKFRSYLADHLMAPAENSPSFYRWQHEGPRLTKGIRKLDSLNRLALLQVLDTLAKYKLTRKDQTYEQFTWLYDVPRRATRSDQNIFQFKKGDLILNITLSSLELIEGHWRFTDKISSEMRTYAEKQPNITCYSTLPQDPKDFAHQFIQSLQSGDLEEVYRAFPSREIIAKSYGKEHEQEVDGVMDDMKAEMQKLADRVYRMKPGEYTIELSSLYWERNSGRRNDMDKGILSFVISYEGKKVYASMKFSVLESGIYVYRYKDEVR